MSCSLTVPIDNLMIWKINSWKRADYNEINLTLKVHCDQLLITSESKILESLNTKEKLKAIYKEDVLILYISRSAQEVRKIKFRIKMYPQKYFKELCKYFPVTSHDSKQSKAVFTPKFRDVEEVIKQAVNMKNDDDSADFSLPPSFKSFVKLCLLDPLFPKLVDEVQRIITNDCKTN